MSLKPTTPIVAVANQKGGVGKTTTVVNLAAALTLADKRVLIVDLDPQGNASTGVDIARQQRNPGTYSVLMDGATGACVQQTSIEGLDIIASDSDLAGAELELVREARREFRLADSLAKIGPYDVILVDCPPSLGLLTLNGLVSATSLLVPLQCEFFALEGLSQLSQTVGHVGQSLNKSLKLDSILLTMFDRRNNLSELVAADARSFFGERVFKTVIPRNVRISEAQSHGKPVTLYDPKSPGAQAYMRVATEFMSRAVLNIEKGNVT